MTQTILGIFTTTIILGVISIQITKKLSGTYVSAASAYWFGWSFLLSGGLIALNKGYGDDLVSLSITPSIFPYILDLHLGSFIGFLFGSIVSSKSKRISTHSTFLKANFIVDNFLNKALILLFICGAIFLFQRVQSAGLSSDYFTNVRQIYLERNRPFVEWLGGHVSMLVIFFTICLGIRDAKDSFNVKDLLILIIASAPLGLGNGNRIFLFMYIMIYFSSFFLFRSTLNSGIWKQGELKKVGILIGTNLLIFSTIGFIRGGYGDEFNFVLTIVMWPVSSLYAMDTWIQEALFQPRTNAFYTLGWLRGLASDLGIVDLTDEHEIINASYSYFLKTQNTVIFIPKTIIPELIFDFGSKGVFWGMLIISFLLQKATLLYAGRNLILHTLAVVSLYAAFISIQGSVISPLFINAIFWSIVLSVYFKFKPFKKSPVTDV